MDYSFRNAIAELLGHEHPVSMLCDMCLKRQLWLMRAELQLATCDILLSRQSDMLRRLSLLTDALV